MPDRLKNRRMTRRLVVLAAILPALARGQGSSAAHPTDTVSAPISNVTYDVTFDRRTAQGRAIGVEMSFATDGSGPVILSLPAWTPGAYEITNFARWVVGFTATSGGKPLPWDKIDFDTWR